jgi:hypothetical protein
MEYYIGGGNSIAICTLSSIDLLQMTGRKKEEDEEEHTWY